jgi:hypothetical protein
VTAVGLITDFPFDDDDLDVVGVMVLVMDYLDGCPGVGDSTRCPDSSIPLDHNVESHLEWEVPQEIS